MVINDYVLEVDVVIVDGDVFKLIVDLYDVDFIGVVFNVVVFVVVGFNVVLVVDLVVDFVVGFVVMSRGCVVFEFDIGIVDDDWFLVWVWWFLNIEGIKLEVYFCKKFNNIL